MNTKTIDLSGIWELTCDKPGFSPIPARIPGENCSALLEAGIVPDPYIGFNENSIQWVRDYDWTWTRKFEITADFLEQKRIWLNVDSLDTVGEIRINGKSVVHSRNMFCRIREDIKPFLHIGENTISFIVTAVEKYTTAELEKLRFKIGADQYWRKMPNLNLVRKIQSQGGWDWGTCIPVSGVYGNVSIDASNGIRIEHVYTEQQHRENECILTVTVEIDSDFNGMQDIYLHFDSATEKISSELHAGLNFIKTSFTVTSPKLWYPVGYGSQPLYTLTVEADSCSVRKKIGLRNLKTVSQPDEHGICLYFEVNGIPVFAKGANWIPMDAMPQRYTRERYDKLLSDAVAANMNTLRVWGGGLYENEDFYDLCDEKGILLWHDCMFACAHYPSTADFLSLVEKELNYQIKRLRDHASIALWCGDNECGQFLRCVGVRELPWILNYDRFNQAVGKAVAAADPTRTFRRTSPCNDPVEVDGGDDNSRGDIHFWKVWHSGADLETYYDVIPRFCSEFGFQSFPSQNAVDIFTNGEQQNVTSPLMEFHQRNTGGNSKIVEMFTRYFRFPESFEDFIYLSQVQQAIAIKTGVEFWRTLKSVCMGATYWQLNDNWPVASWSSIDYYGNWKQLHYHAKRFFAPVLVTAIKKDGRIEIHAVSDLQIPLSGEIHLKVVRMSGEIIKELVIPVKLKVQESLLAAAFTVENLQADPTQDFLTLEFDEEQQKYTAHNEFFFSKYKEYALPDANIHSEIFCQNDVWHLSIETDKPAFYIFAEFNGIPAVFSDNSLTVLPGKKIDLTFDPVGCADKKALVENLRIRHLGDSYKK